jgi:hypothetical protein
MIMAEETKKSEGPVCACGRPDLYEESLKLKEKSQGEDTCLTTPNQESSEKSSVDSSGKEDQ